MPLEMKRNLELSDTGTLPPDAATHTYDRSRAVYVSTVSKGDPLPRAKRIAWLKTSDFEGCNHPDGGFRKKKERDRAKPRRPMGN